MKGKGLTVIINYCNGSGVIILESLILERDA